jgi:SAM-dependent methyltransferase
MIGQQQLSNRTAYNRYPRVFRKVAESLPPSGSVAPRTILSYGCSTGEEASALSDIYFRNDRVIGLDVSPEVIEIAKNAHAGGKILFDLSNAETLAKYGPYDCIFAMSVLCRWPESENLADISELYRFEEFETAVGELDKATKVGGILTIYNSNFNFLDTTMSSRYEVVPVMDMDSNGFVHRFDRHNKRILNYTSSDCVYRKMRA